MRYIYVAAADARLLRSSCELSKLGWEDWGFDRVQGQQDAQEVSCLTDVVLSGAQGEAYGPVDASPGVNR